MESTRRGFLGSAVALAATFAADSARARWETVTRYPDPAFENLDPSFARHRLDAAAVEHLWTGARRSEGPVWVADGRYLLWSDIPNDRVLCWHETTGTVDEYLKPAGYHDGHTRDREGRVVAREHGGRRIIRVEHDGSVTVLADRFEGKRPNSPNGVVFSPDEKRLYVVEAGVNPRAIRVFDVVDGHTLANDRVFYPCRPGERPDGFRVDVDGNLWCGWGMNPEFDGVRVIDPAGAAIGHIHLPERCANLGFGGERRNRVFMAASKSLYAIYVNAKSASGG
ncbi:Gluconolactonase [uncultured Alphaproteobacteria bacterium]|uniref:Gluconolactonase n=1 Tax=uncultured Alphaproteobacteria bacterium TaxID=91750 RepID=A0A212K5N1_9PROT|nr:Gluconolactonase [uncultured Alphaproteobacteria bacterium]